MVVEYSYPEQISLIQIRKSNFEKFHLTLQTANLKKSTTLGISDCVFRKSNLNLDGYGKASLKRDMFITSTSYCTYVEKSLYFSN